MRSYIHKNMDVQHRCVLALFSFNVSRDDILNAFGISDDVHLIVQLHRIPPTAATIERLAFMAGVTSGWILTGEPVNDRDFLCDRYFTSRQSLPPERLEAAGSSIITGNHADQIHVSVQSGSGTA